MRISPLNPYRMEDCCIAACGAARCPFRVIKRHAGRLDSTAEAPQKADEIHFSKRGGVHSRSMGARVISWMCAMRVSGLHAIGEEVTSVIPYHSITGVSKTRSSSAKMRGSRDADEERTRRSRLSHSRSRLWRLASACECSLTRTRLLKVRVLVYRGERAWASRRHRPSITGAPS